MYSVQGKGLMEMVWNIMAKHKKEKCEYYRSCVYYREGAFTCNHIDSPSRTKCGVRRTLRKHEV